MSSSMRRSTARRSAVGTAARAAAVSVLCLGLAAGTAAPALAAGSGHGAQPRRGTLVSATELVRMDAGQATAYVQGMGFATAPAAEDGVDVYRLTYRTVDPAGRPTTASGVVAPPHSASARGPHGLPSGATAFRVGCVLPTGRPSPV
ncbi:hypothetical protein [Streptomyces sp. CB01881]|uniref:hypothetical protein n=1 Tax=Streptomyces sp. CB01881 TaxID=2078691 RepID=UPI000CDC9602|nr:hypothetical protein [Streptomyces sp. CB01881]AUY48565.1 hypothetical protein C2142_05885 [Streptomyces sp. CB01881]TYC77055.1 hypothetical protein EH183_05890 [Streptomyces sp. CB01881]